MNNRKKDGFTLIELLAVIIILGVILMVVVPITSGIINSIKTSAYNTQVDNIIDAAKRYALTKGKNPTINTQRVITLKELQDNNYYTTNVINQSNGLTIPDTTGVAIVNNNGSYSYHYLGYSVDGLILHYDGIYNGGYGVHNDNTSTNKNTWENLSGNNYDSNLTNFDFKSTSGWSSNSLIFDGSDDAATTTSIMPALSTYTFEILFKPYSYKYTQIGFGTIDFKWRIIGNYPYWNYLDSSNNTNTMHHVNIPVLNKATLFSANFSGSSQKIFLDGILNLSSVKSFIPKNPTVL
ncbi:MAG: type II secretion system protein, partial [Bacilli bacterium]